MTRSTTHTLRAKLSFIVIGVILLVMVPFAGFTGYYLEHLAAEEAVNQLTGTNAMIRDMISLQQEGLRLAVQRLGTAFRANYRGTFSLDQHERMVVGEQSLPVLKLDGQMVNLDHSAIDLFTRETGGAVATLFARDGENFVRVATSLTQLDGSRAVGTVLGSKHPAYQLILTGQTYRGSARLFGRHYMTEYVPVRDKQQRVVAILFVGMDLTDSLNLLRDKLRTFSIGRNGYPFLIDAEPGMDYGRFLVHPTLEGQTIPDSLKSSIRLDAHTQDTYSISYSWNSPTPGNSLAGEKIAVISTYPELGWVIGASGYLDDFLNISRQGQRYMLLALLVVSLLIIVSLNLAVGRMMVMPLLRMQNKLSESEQTLRTILDNMQEGALLHRADGSVTQANRKFLAMFGLEGEGAALPDKAEDFLAQGPSHHELGEFWRRALTGEAQYFEATARRPLDGSTFDAEVYLCRCNIRGEDMVLANVRDISRSKQAEATVRLLSRAVEQSPVSIVITDVDGRIEYVNARFSQISGYAPEDVIGQAPRLLKSGETPPEVYEELWRTIKVGGTWTGRLHNRKKNGELYWESAVIQGIADEQGHVVNFLAVKEDITARMAAEASIQELNLALEKRVAERTAELQQAMKDMEAFSYSVSHDLRAPLRAISGYSRLLMEHENDRLTEDGQGMLARIEKSGIHMAQLIDDILEYSRAGRQSMRQTEVDLTHLARDVARELQENYPQATISIDALPTIHGDPAMLRQILSNLIGNGLKYSAKKPDSQVAVGVRQVGEQTEIFIRDNGAGFDMRYAGRLFGMFQRMHSEQEFSGTGVGLAIVKRLVERLGGQVRAEAEIDRGATFSFTVKPVSSAPAHP